MIYQRDTSVNLNIRHLEQEDFKEVTKIFSFKSVTENTSQNPFVNADMVASLFDSKDRYNLVALIDTEVVGYISLIMSSKARSKHCAAIALAVHPDHHRKGVGRALLGEIINQADNWLNIIRLELEVQADNTAAIKLYESLGFELEGVKRCATFSRGRYFDLNFMSRVKKTASL